MFSLLVTSFDTLLFGFKKAPYSRKLCSSLWKYVRIVCDRDTYCTFL